MSSNKHALPINKWDATSRKFHFPFPYIPYMEVVLADQGMVYGSLEQKWAYLAPVFERVRFLHGRIGSPGSIQVSILPHQDLHAIAHFQEMWTCSCLGFLRSAQPGDYFYFVAELLGPAYDYARLMPTEHGELIEDDDRWQEAIAYQRLASACFHEAQRRFQSIPAGDALC